MAYGERPYTSGQTAGSFVAEGDRPTVVESALVHPVHTDGFVNKGDPVVFGNLHGIAMKSVAANTEYVPFERKGMWNVSVLGHTGSANDAIAAGDPVYIDTTNGVVDKDSNQQLFGVAMMAVGSGVTLVVPVTLVD